MILTYWKIELMVYLFKFLGIFSKWFFHQVCVDFLGLIFLMSLLIFCSMFCLNWNNINWIKWSQNDEKILRVNWKDLCDLKEEYLFHVNKKSFPISNHSAYPIWQYPHDFLQNLVISFLWTSHKPPFCHCSQYTPSRSSVFSHESVKKHDSFNKKPTIKD